MLVVCIFASALGALIMCLLVLRDGFSPISSDPSRADRDVLVTRLGHAVAGACFATTAIVATVLVARSPAPAPAHQLTDRITTLERERRALGEQVSALGTSVRGLQERIDTASSDLQGMRLRLDQTQSRFVKTENGLGTAETALARSEATLAKIEAALAKTDAGLKRLSEEVANAKARQQVERPVAVKPAAAPPRDGAAPSPARPPQRRTDADRPQEIAPSATAEAVAPPPAASSAHAPVAPPAHKPAPVATPTHKPAPSAAASAPPQDLRERTLTDKMRKDWDTIRKGFSTAGDDIANALRRFGRD